MTTANTIPNKRISTVLFNYCILFVGATSIEKYELRTNSWSQVAQMNGRRLQFGVAVLDNKLYVVGGRDGLKTLNTVECYDAKKKTWSLMPPHGYTQTRAR